MSYTEWETVEGRQEARGSGKPWRMILTYKADSPAGSTPLSETYQVGIETCSHHDGLYCGGTRDEHPMICSCFGPGMVEIKSEFSDRIYQGHEFT